MCKLTPINNRLGSYHFVHCGDIYVINAFTQYFYGYDGKKYVSYDAISDIFKDLNEMGVKELAIPKVGCGLAGGNWNIVESIIKEVAPDINITVYVKE